MNLEKLQQVLDRLLRSQNLIDHEAVRELEKVNNLFLEFATISVDDFCAGARKTFGSAGAKKPTKPSPSVNDAVVSSYLRELDTTKKINDEFEAVISRMKIDKQIRVAEAREIASRFVGGSQNYKTKAETFKAILERQFADLRAKNKIGRIGEIF